MSSLIPILKNLENILDSILQLTLSENNTVKYFPDFPKYTQSSQIWSNVACYVTSSKIADISSNTDNF